MCCNLPLRSDCENRIQRMEHVGTEQTCWGTGQGIGNSGHERYKVEGNDKGLREQRDEFQGEGRMAYPYCGVQCLSREAVGDDPAINENRWFCQRICFVYTAEKALLNTQETKEIWWWRQWWCHTGMHQGEECYRWAKWIGVSVYGRHP